MPTCAHNCSQYVSHCHPLSLAEATVSFLDGQVSNSVGAVRQWLRQVAIDTPHCAGGNVSTMLARLGQ